MGPDHSRPSLKPMEAFSVTVGKVGATVGFGIGEFYVCKGSLWPSGTNPEGKAGGRGMEKTLWKLPW